MKKLIFLSIFSIFWTAIIAQNPTPPPPSKLAPTDLDFWLGEWDATWPAPSGDSLERGQNIITRDLDGKVIAENFSVFNGKNAGFNGKSWSVFNEKTKTWQQTWVDNSGGYLDFESEKTPEGFVFKRDFDQPNGRHVHQKMVFHDISKDRFVWDWKSSTDGGRTWKMDWQITYTRQKPQPVDLDFAMKQVAKGKKYFVVFLKTGATPEISNEENAKMQGEHLVNLFRLNRAGQLLIFGPFLDEKSDLSGLSIYQAESREEVEKLLNLDPTISSGRLVYEIREWFSIPGLSLK